MSIFASNEPVPKAETIADTVSTDTYDKEQRVGSIPSVITQHTHSYTSTAYTIPYAEWPSPEERE